LNKQNHNHCTPEDLYKNLLEIGSECITCGTNLKEIKQKLCDSKLINKDEDDNTLSLLFIESFYDNTHFTSKTCKHPFPDIELPDEEYEKLKKLHDDHNHLEECTWFLKSDSLMNLFKLKESENNAKIAKTAQCISYAAILISFLILLSNWLSKPDLNDLYENDDFKAIKNKMDSIEKHNKYLVTKSNHADSIYSEIKKLSKTDSNNIM